MEENSNNILISKTARILDRMIGRRTNHDIQIMAARYLNKKITKTEYEILLERMLQYGIEADEFNENYCLEADAYERLLADKKRYKASLKSAGKYRKNKQKHTRGKPKK